MTEELKACPFCGEQHRMRSSAYGGNERYMEICIGNTHYYGSPEEMREAWNTRSAIADTRPQGGDAQQAPFTSGGGAGTAIARKDAA